MPITPPPEKPFPVAYDDAMLRSVRELHAGAESLAGYEGWIRDHMGGRVQTFRQRLIPNIQAFVELDHLTILDFGCGTGSSTVALAEKANACRILGADLSIDALRIAQLRFGQHALNAAIDLVRIGPVGQGRDLPLSPACMDLIVLNGVLEHVVPYRERPFLILELWRILRPGGCLYINETPNPLWPIDRHTTGLPLIPWLPSRLAHRLAVFAGKHNDATDLDARGRRGMSWWSIVAPLRRAHAAFEVLNITRARNRLLPAGPPAGDRVRWRRRLGTTVLEAGLGPVLGRFGIPTLALSPWIDHLCLRKPPA